MFCDRSANLSSTELRDSWVLMEHKALWRIMAANANKRWPVSRGDTDMGASCENVSLTFRSTRSPVSLSIAALRTRRRCEQSVFGGDSPNQVGMYVDRLSGAAIR